MDSIQMSTGISDTIDPTSQFVSTNLNLAVQDFAVKSLNVEFEHNGLNDLVHEHRSLNIPHVVVKRTLSSKSEEEQNQNIDKLYLEQGNAVQCVSVYKCKHAGCAPVHGKNGRKAIDASHSFTGQENFFQDDELLQAQDIENLSVESTLFSDSQLKAFRLRMYCDKSMRTESFPDQVKYLEATLPEQRELTKLIATIILAIDDSSAAGTITTRLGRTPSLVVIREYMDLIFL